MGWETERTALQYIERTKNQKRRMSSLLTGRNLSEPSPPKVSFMNVSPPEKISNASTVDASPQEKMNSPPPEKMNSSPPEKNKNSSPEIVFPPNFGFPSSKDSGAGERSFEGHKVYKLDLNGAQNITLNFH